MYREAALLPEKSETTSKTRCESFASKTACPRRIPGQKIETGALPQLQCHAIAGKQSMEESAPHLFVGVLVVPHRVIESAQKFFAAYLVCAPIYEFLYERPHSFIVRNGESVCVA